MGFPCLDKPVLTQLGGGGDMLIGSSCLPVLMVKQSRLMS